jgi:hypothetical protein
MLKRWIERRKVIQQMGTYMDREVMQDILDGSPRPDRRPCFLGYVLVQCKDDDVESCLTLMNEIYDIAHEAGALFGDSVYSLRCFTFGYFEAEGGIEGKCEQLAERLVSTFPHDVKVIYGYGEFEFGSYGRETLMHHGPLLTGLSTVLPILYQLPYGQSRIVNKPAGPHTPA